MQTRINVRNHALSGELPSHVYLSWYLGFNEFPIKSTKERKKVTKNYYHSFLMIRL